jgi:hypothetical protein
MIPPRSGGPELFERRDVSTPEPGKVVLQVRAA